MAKSSDLNEQEIAERNKLHRATLQRMTERFGWPTAQQMDFTVVMLINGFPDGKSQIAFLHFLKYMLDKQMSAHAIMKQLYKIDLNDKPNRTFGIKYGPSPRLKQKIKLVVYALVGLFLLAAFNNWI